MCAVNDQPSKEQSYRFKDVLKGALQISSPLCLPKCTSSSSTLMPNVSLPMALLMFCLGKSLYCKGNDKQKAQTCGEEGKMISFQTNALRLSPSNEFLYIVPKVSVRGHIHRIVRRLALLFT